MQIEFGNSVAVKFWDLGIEWLAGLGPAAQLSPGFGIRDLGFRLSADAQGEYGNRRIGIWLKLYC